MTAASAIERAASASARPRIAMLRSACGAGAGGAGLPPVSGRTRKASATRTGTSIRGTRIGS